MDNAHALSALQERYSSTLGLLRQTRAKVDCLEADLRTLSATIRMFQADWTGEGMPAKRPRQPTMWSHHGEGIEAAIHVMREAGEPLPLAEIVRRIMIRKRLTDLRPETIKLLKASTQAALYSRRGKGVVTERRASGPILWALGD